VICVEVKSLATLGQQWRIAVQSSVLNARIMRRGRPMAHAVGAAMRTGGPPASPFLGGCSVAPSHSILGSFFPTWFFCALLGVVTAILAHKVLAWAGVADKVPAPLLVYLALSIAGAFAFWLIWLG
jgi:hypothetical protein